MTTSGRKAGSTEQGRLLFEHVDRRGRVRLLPLTLETQKLLASGLFGVSDRQRGEAAPAGGQPPARTRSFTAREWQVFDLLVSGLSSKLIAHELEISSRTVEIHRANLMRKMGVRNTASLVRMAFAAA
jgi:two-component system response regulator FixJ